jgi:hypothetical protein
MRTQGRTLGGRLPRRMCTLIAAGAALAAVGFGPTLGTATADTPAHTDVMLVFDTSGSMESVLTSAKQEVKEVIASVNATLPDVHYGVAEVRDFPGDEATAAESTADLGPRRRARRDRTAVCVQRR